MPSMPFAMRRGRRGGLSISTAATRTTARCRWITSSGRRFPPRSTVVVDAGFTAAVAARRQRTYLRTPMDGLAPARHRLRRPCGTSSSPISTTIMSAISMPSRQATFYVQEREMAFWTGRHAGRGHFRTLVEPEDVLFLVRENFARRVRYVRETAEIVPGITVHHVGGHAAGLQVVRVPTGARQHRARLGRDALLRRTSRRIAHSASSMSCRRCTMPSIPCAASRTRRSTSCRGTTRS